MFSNLLSAWVGSLSIGLVFFTGPLSGILVNRLGCRVTTLLGSFLCALRLSLASFSDGLLALYFSYSIPFGVGTCLVFNASLVVASRYFSKGRSLALGIVSLGQGLGVLIYGPTLQALIDNYGWKITYRIVAAVVFGICLLALTFDPNVKPEKQVNQESNPITKENERPEGQRARRFILDVSVWKVPEFVAINHRFFRCTLRAFHSTNTSRKYDSIKQQPCTVNVPGTRFQSSGR